MDDYGITIKRIRYWVYPYWGRFSGPHMVVLMGWFIIGFTTILPKSQISYVIWRMMAHELICLGGLYMFEGNHHFHRATVLTCLNPNMVGDPTKFHLYRPIQLRLGGWYHYHSPFANVSHFFCQCFPLRFHTPQLWHLKTVCWLWMQVPYVCS